MTTRDGDVLRYMSDQWSGRVFGYEARQTRDHGEVNIAQSSPVALAVLGVGGGSAGVWRDLGNRYPWHHLGRDCAPAPATTGPAALAQAMLGLIDARGHALPTLRDEAVLWGSGLSGDLSGQADRLDRIAQSVRELCAWAEELGRVCVVDCVPLALMEAEEGHWTGILAALARDVGLIRECIIAASGQMVPPSFIISQNGGTGDDGCSPLALAEARAVIDLWGLGVTVATPRYHLAIEKGTRARLTPASARELSEIEAHAHLARRDGRQWFCPLMTRARMDGRVIHADFTLGDDAVLVLDDAQAHGFSLGGDGAGGAAIVSVAARGRRVVIELDRQPQAPFELRYAWGAQGSGQASDRLANSGSLRDDWACPSMNDPGLTLHRRALSQCVDVQSGAF